MPPSPHAQVLSHWLERDLQVAPLEAFLLQHLDVFAPPLGALMAVTPEADDETDSAREAGAVATATVLLRRLSPAAYLAITERRLALLGVADDAGTGSVWAACARASASDSRGRGEGA